MEEQRTQRDMRGERAIRHGRFTFFGWLFYCTGVRTEYFFVLVFRALARSAEKLRYGVRVTVGMLRRETRRLFGAVWEDLCAPWRQMAVGLRNLCTFVREERAIGGSPAKAGALYLWRGVRSYRHLVWETLSCLLPFAALAVLLFTVRAMLASTYALRVEYHGEIVGFIEHESVWDKAFADILDRVQNAGTEEDWLARPVYTLTIVDSAALYSSDELANRIIETSDSDFCSATGVYVDSEFIGVTRDSTGLVGALDALKAPWEAGHENDADWRVEFQHQVELKPGLYFTNTTVSLSELLARLHGLQPVLLEDGSILQDVDLIGVQAVQNVTRTVEVTLPDQVVEDKTLEWGADVVEQESVVGLEELYEEVVYIDGQEVRRTETRERTVLVEAKAKITRHGVFNPYEGEAGEAATGEFAWPVPHYKEISRWVGGPDRHRGADIVADTGTTIIAADNGIVEIATDARGTALWSYGKFVKIDHGNGFTTLYGHCSELLVSQGETVVKGQPIARVGSTGRSTGAHCHFEIQINGQWTDTRRYVMPPGYEEDAPPPEDGE